MRKNFLKRLLCGMLSAALLLSSAACGSSDRTGTATEPSGPQQTVPQASTQRPEGEFITQTTEFDLLQCIDTSSVVCQGDTVKMNAILPNGRVIRLEGVGVELLSNGSLMCSTTESRFYCLDALGGIASMELKSSAEDVLQVKYTGGYSFNGTDRVERFDELFLLPDVTTNSDMAINLNEMYPDYFCFSATGCRYKESYTSVVAFEQFIIRCTGYVSGIKEIRPNQDYFPRFIAGEKYDRSIETAWDPDNGVYSFYLQILPDVPNAKAAPAYCIDGTGRYTVGDLKDSKGDPVSKDGPVPEGATLEVTVGAYTMDIPLCQQIYTGAGDLDETQELVLAYPRGTVTALVIPVCWRDQREQITAESLDNLKKALGRVVDKTGTVTDYSALTEDSKALSTVYKELSFGKLTMQSFVTDWYYHEAVCTPGGSWDAQTVRDLTQWAQSLYPGMDWSIFDGDGDGAIDVLILVNTCTEAAESATFAGSYWAAADYTGAYCGSRNRPGVGSYISLNLTHLADSTVLTEQVARAFGAPDFSDSTGSGISCLGGEEGPWNAFSRLAAGWAEPYVVTEDMVPDGGLEVTLQPFAEDGQCVVIPARGSSYTGPLSEYILVELYTAQSAEGETVGLKIYHVNALYTQKTLTNARGETVIIGVPHTSCDYNEEGVYCVELIQAGGGNTFTNLQNLRPEFTDRDLFQAGDVFNIARYSSFFRGAMDDGSTFGYNIEVLAVESGENGASATISITYQ